MSNTAIHTLNHTRRLGRVVEARHTIEGEGFEVRRAVPNPGLESLGPFIFLDHWGPLTYGPGEAKGAPDHPHAGFETLTYLLEGTSIHRDSIGNVSSIGPLEAQWMRAGRGIIHDEGPDPAHKRDGGPSHGVQLWIDLPKGHKHDAPAYRHVGRETIPEWREAGAVIRLVAGHLAGRVGPVATFADPLLAHVQLAPKGQVTLDLPQGIEAGAYVLQGSLTLDGRVVADGRLAVFEAGGRSVTLEAGASGADVLLLGGPAVADPLLRYGPFVMNTEQELIDAINAFRSGGFGRLAPAPAV